MENKFYVYVYLNPNIEGEFIYGEYVFDYEPFYIGKGFGDRLFHHLKCKGRNHNKNIIIKDLLRENKTPIILKIKENLSNEDSLILEKEMIKLIGRLDIGTGTLTNLTEGGEGHIGYIQSEETKRKRVESLKKSTLLETMRSNEFRENTSKRFKEFFKDPKNREAISERMKGDKNPMYGKTTSEKQKESVRQAHKDGKVKLTPEGRQKIIESNKKRKGKKNSVVRKDINVFYLISPSKQEFIINGAVNLQSFCKEYKLQLHTLKKHINKEITSEDVVGNKIFARNTIGWILKKDNDE